MSELIVKAGGLLALLAAGCMHIDPDPELPDVVLAWPQSCEDGGAIVHVTATPLDGADGADGADGEVVTEELDCAEGEGRIADLARARHAVTAELRTEDGELVGRALPIEVDLRDGVTAPAWVEFLIDEGLVLATWTFPAGVDCASLGADGVNLQLTGDWWLGLGAACARGMTEPFTVVPAGTYTVAARASSSTTSEIVARAEVRAGVVIAGRGELTDLGTFVLVPCDGPCEDAP